MNPDIKTIRDLIRVTDDYFAGKGIDSARLNAERLLADVLGLSRIELYCQHDRPVLGEELDRYRELVRRRASGEPLQAILGLTEFYSRSFRVEPGVFIPRPETETLVEIAVGLLSPPDRRLLAPLAVEIGCGTGIVGVSLAAEIPRLTVYATDVNAKAVDLAGRNAHAVGVDARTHFLTGSRFDPLPEQLQGEVDLLVSNPPYVSRDELPELPPEVGEYDPVESLDGGPEGLDFYHALAAGMGRWLRPGGWIAVEIGYDQGEQVSDIFAASGAMNICVDQDLAGRDRVVTGQIDPPEEE